MTLSALARKAGIDKGQLSRAFNGLIDLSPWQVDQMADVLKISAAERSELHHASASDRYSGNGLEIELRVFQEDFELALASLQVIEEERKQGRPENSISVARIVLKWLERKTESASIIIETKRQLFRVCGWIKISMVLAFEELLSHTEMEDAIQPLVNEVCDIGIMCKDEELANFAKYAPGYTSHFENRITAFVQEAHKTL